MNNMLYALLHQKGDHGINKIWRDKTLNAIDAQI